MLLAVWVPWGLAHVSGWQSVPSVRYVSRVLASWRLQEAVTGTNTRAENLAPFKFYWTPCSLGLSTVAEEAVAWRWRWRAAAPCCCPPPQLCRDPREEGRVGRRTGLETDHQPSPTPWGGALSISTEMAQGCQPSCPTNPRPWGQPLTASPQPAMWPTRARWPAARLPGSEGHQWGPPRSSAVDTPGPSPLR